jgi:hypothetical protein
MKLFLKSKIVASLSSLLLLTSVSAFSADTNSEKYQRVEKELKIMSKIFETSLSEHSHGNNRNHFSSSSRKTEATYLAKQGMVFTFKFNQSGFNNFGDSNDWQAFGEGVGHLVGSITSEIASSFANLDIETPEIPEMPNIPRPNGDWEKNMEAYEVYQEAMEHLRDEQRDQREEVRELQRNIREVEREARREKEDVNTKELEKTKSKLKEKMKVLSKKMEQYEKSKMIYQQKKLEKIKAKNKTKSDSILATLCDYGSTLRSLKNNEYITLVFENYANDNNQIHVFSFKDVESCSNKDNLLKKAVSYQL